MIPSNIFNISKSISHVIIRNENFVLNLILVLHLHNIFPLIPLDIFNIAKFIFHVIVRNENFVLSIILVTFAELLF